MGVFVPMPKLLLESSQKRLLLSWVRRLPLENTIEPAVNDPVPVPPRPTGTTPVKLAVMVFPLPFVEMMPSPTIASIFPAGVALVPSVLNVVGTAAADSKFNVPAPVVIVIVPPVDVTDPALMFGDAVAPMRSWPSAVTWADGGSIPLKSTLFAHKTSLSNPATIYPYVASTKYPTALHWSVSPATPVHLTIALFPEATASTFAAASAASS